MYLCDKVWTEYISRSLKKNLKFYFFFQALIIYKSMHHFPDSANLEDKQGRHH